MRVPGMCLGFVAAVVAVVTAGPPAAGQNKDKDLEAFFSSSPAEPADGDPKNNVANLYLRPNIEQAAYVYVRNKGRDERTVTVVMSSVGKDARAGTELVRAKGVVVQPGRTVRVPFPNSSNPPAQAAVAAPADEKAAGRAVPPPGVRLGPTQLVLEVIDEKENRPEDRQAFRRAVELDVRSPREFIKAIPDFPESNQLVITAEFDRNFKLFSDKPARVRLDLRPDLNPDLDLDTLNTGTYEADLPTDGKVELIAQGVKFKPASSRLAVVALSVDGYDRAFLYKTNFSGRPDELSTGEPFVNIRPSAAKLVPGQPCQLRLEFSYTGPDKFPDLELLTDRRNQNEFVPGTATVANRYPGPQRKEIYFSAGGPADAIVFHTVLTDWVYDFPTANVFGVRWFKLQAVDPRTDPRKVVPSNSEAEAVQKYNVRNIRPVVLDRTPPAVKLARPKGVPIVGQKLTLAARGVEDLTDFKDVLFYIGDPPAPGAKLVPGKLVRGTPVSGAGPKTDPEFGPRDRTYEATLTLPDVKGLVQVGVKFVNEVGLASRDDEGVTYFYLDVQDPPAPRGVKEKLTGTIKGRVTQGSRPQPGLPVELRDEDGKKVLKATRADDAGEFRFDDVPPGSYTVVSVKKVDASKGVDKVSVEPGKTSLATLNVLR